MITYRPTPSLDDFGVPWWPFDESEEPGGRSVLPRTADAFLVRNACPGRSRFNAGRKTPRLACPGINDAGNSRPDRDVEPVLWRSMELLTPDSGASFDALEISCRSTIAMALSTTRSGLS